MANKTLLWGSQSLEPDDQILYVEISPGVYALATASIIISGAPGGDGAAPVVNIEPALTDEITGATVTIPVVHHEVHEGDTFIVSLFSMVNGNGDDIAILLRTGLTRYGHMTFTVAAGGDAQVRLLENPTVSADGNPLTEYNMQRYSTNVAEITAFGNPTYIEQATIPMNFLSPGGTGGNSQGGVVRQNTEWDLSLSTDYVIELTNIAAGNQPLSITAQWYEESTA
jgi:hypothetical protein